MLRAVIYDFNGVLVDDEPLHLELFQRVLEEEGIGLGEEEYYAEYLGYDDRGCFAAVLQAAGEEPSAARLARLIARKSSYYQEHIRRHGYPFFPGAAAAVRDCAGRGWVLAVVSGALREEVEGALAQEGLEDLFKTLVAAEDVSAGKPDPEGYRRVLEALNTRPPLPERLFHPHEVLVVEDSPAGLEAAAAAGLPTLAVANTYPPGALSTAGAVIAGTAELSARRIEEVYRQLVGEPV